MGSRKRISAESTERGKEKQRALQFFAIVLLHHVK
jgi:hypothetical protein